MSLQEFTKVGYFKLYHLSKELLLHVVSMLDFDSIIYFRRSCHKFCSVTDSPSLWYNIKWKSNGTSIHFKNMVVCLKLSQKYLQNLSLTCNAIPHCLTKIVHLIKACSRLQSISLTNFTCTCSEIKILLDLPALFELHVLSFYSGDSIFPAIVNARCNLRILSILRSNYSFSDWADSGYNPPDLRVLLPRVPTWRELIVGIYQYNTSNTTSGPSIQHRACLSFYELGVKLTSKLSDSIIQFYFCHPNMKPFMYCFQNSSKANNLDVIENGMEVNSFFGAANCSGTFETTNLDLQRECITSLTMFGQLFVTSTCLETIALKCPNLVHLDLQHSEGCLHNLNGLDAIASTCPKLHSLNMATREYCLSINAEILWRIISKMNNLTALTIPSYFIRWENDVVILPKLESVNILHMLAYPHVLFMDTYCQFSFTSMPSLKYLRFESTLDAAPINSLTNIIHSFDSLSHLFIRKTDDGCGDLTLPLDLYCYRNLEYIYLSSKNFILYHDFANTLSRCEYLQVLALKINYISLASIKHIFYSLNSLTLFIVQTLHSLFHPKGAGIMWSGRAEEELYCKKQENEFSGYLREEAMSQGRILDVLITSDLRNNLLNDSQLHTYFSL